MRRIPPSIVAPGHPDFERLSRLKSAISTAVGAAPEQAFVKGVLEAIDFVLDPIRTGRTDISQLDNVEKTFVGLKVEHFIRDFLNAPKGVRDLVLGGEDVDIKNTISSSGSWMIPPETFRNEEPVVLIASDHRQRKSWMGLMLTRDAYLTKDNRDDKRGIAKGAYQNILWLADGVDWPASHWQGIDMARFRELRRMRGGTKRAAKFFEENVGKIVDRRVIVALLFDQRDPMKRLRGNKGARDLLKPNGLALLSGAYDRPLLARLGYSLTPDEHVAVRGATYTEVGILRQAGKIS